MAFCHKCGADLDGGRFCSSCGADNQPITVQEVTPTEVPAAAPAPAPVPVAGPATEPVPSEGPIPAPEVVPTYAPEAYGMMPPEKPKSKKKMCL